jgi:hypothetical protein
VNEKLSTKKQFTPIQSYKPSGNLVYNEEMFTKTQQPRHPK